MKLLSENLKKEKSSIRNFSQLLNPWQIIKPEDDTGIDLIVWPYVGKDENRPDERQLFVQMKSTSDISLVNDSEVSMQLQTEHIQGWKKLDIPVVVVLNELNTNTFYFAWARDVVLKLDQKNQKVVFSDKFSGTDCESVKLYILRKLYPLKVIDRAYAFTPSGGASTIFSCDAVKGIENFEFEAILKFVDGLKDEFEDDERVYKLQQIALLDPNKNIEVCFRLAMLYIKRKEQKSAINEMRKILVAGTWPDILRANIIISVLNENNSDLLTRVEDWRFAFYVEFQFGWFKDHCEVSLDGNTIKLELIDDCYSIFPDVAFNEIAIHRIQAGAMSWLDIRCGLFLDGKVLRHHSVRFS